MKLLTITALLLSSLVVGHAATLKTYPLKHVTLTAEQVSAADRLTRLNAAKPEDCHTTYDQNANTLVVATEDATLAWVDELVRNFDVATPNCYVDVLVAAPARQGVFSFLGFRRNVFPSFDALPPEQLRTRTQKLKKLDTKKVQRMMAVGEMGSATWANSTEGSSEDNWIGHRFRFLTDGSENNVQAVHYTLEFAHFERGHRAVQAIQGTFCRPKKTS